MDAIQVFLSEVVKIAENSVKDEYDTTLGRLEAEAVRSGSGKTSPEGMAALRGLMEKMGPKEFMRRNAQRLQMHLKAGPHHPEAPMAKTSMDPFEIPEGKGIFSAPSGKGIFSVPRGRGIFSVPGKKEPEAPK